MDALAVSIANGFAIKELKLRYALRISFFFGFFQALMPIFGWFAGLTFRSYIQKWDHWIAFGLLLLIGVKMIWESKSKDMKIDSINCLHFPTLLLLSLATSMDALAVGISFAVLEMAIIVPVVIIGGITWVICFMGTQMGHRVGLFSGNIFGFIGGIILILIGVKIVIEHSMKNI